MKVTDFGMSRIIPEKVQNKEMGIDETDRFSKDGSVDGDNRDSTWSEVGMPIQRESIALPRSTEISETLTTSGAHRYSSFHPEMTSNLGTTAWCAPELLTTENTTRYSVKVDVYSFGMVMWELWEKRRPYDEFTSRFDITDAIRAGKRPAVSENCPPAYRSLLQRCWQAEPARRPTFKYIEKYLKDELARVRRQKGTNVRLSSIDSRTSLSHRLLSESSGPGSARDLLGAQSMSANAKERSTSPIPITNPIVAPEGRSPLIAFDRSFSYLAQSIENSSASASMDSFGQSPTSLPYFKESQKPIIHDDVVQHGQPKGWRDRYVLKFSGWQASNPDSGLPPSKLAANPMHLSSSSNQRKGNESELELDVIEEGNRESNTTVNSLRNSTAPIVTNRSRFEASEDTSGIFPSDLDDVGSHLPGVIMSKIPIVTVENSGTGASQLGKTSQETSVRPSFGLHADTLNL